MTFDAVSSVSVGCLEIELVMTACFLINPHIQIEPGYREAIFWKNDAVVNLGPGFL